jgi:hypothetical protein
MLPSSDLFTVDSLPLFGRFYPYQHLEAVRINQLPVSSTSGSMDPSNVSDL